MIPQAEYTGRTITTFVHCLPAIPRKRPTLFSSIVRSFGVVESSFDEVGANLEKVGTNFDKLGINFEKVGTDFDKVGANFDKVEINFEKVEANLLALGSGGPTKKYASTLGIVVTKLHWIHPKRNTHIGLLIPRT